MSKNTNLSFLTDYITADITNGRIGINTPSPAYSFDVTGLERSRGTTASDTAPLGSELAAVTGTGTNWTLAGTNLNVGGYTHTVGSTTALTTSLAAASGTYYQITYTITRRTAGSITITYGGTSTAGITASGNTGPLASSTAVLTITPTTDFDGTIVLSIKSIGTSSASSTFANSSGTSNIEVRASSLTTNTFIGLNTGYRNTTGNNNTFYGRDAGLVNTTGFSNTFIGTSAGATNKTGSLNVFVGNNAGFNTNASYNVGIGDGALLSNTTGGDNVAIGQGAGGLNTTGSLNFYLGSGTIGNTTGSGNVMLGVYAGRWIANGSTLVSVANNSILIGGSTKVLADNQTNQIVIGQGTTGLGSNTTVLGNSSTVTTAIYGNLLLVPSAVLGINTADGSDNGYLALSGANGDGTSRGGHIYLSGNERADDAGSVVIAGGTTSSGTGATASVLFRTSGTERMRITSAGNVGIGTTSPAELLVVYGTSASRPRLIVGPITTSTALYSTYNSQDTPAIEINASTANGFAGLTMSNSNNTSGNALGGITFAASGSSATDKRGAIIGSGLESASTSSISSNLYFFTNNANSLGERMRIKSDGQVIIGDTSMLYTNADGHPFGVKSTGSQCFISLAYAGQTLASGGLSVGITTAAAYYFVRDFVPIIFATGNNERMRMLANGNLSLGTTSDVGAKIYIVSSTSYGIVYQNASVNNFYVGVGGDGYLRASAWSYGSDIRMKENISDVSNGLDLITKLKPKHFDYIDGIKNNLGFIAQDVQELIPQAVSISDKKTGMLALKTDFIIPYLVKSIQELSAEITILKNK